MLDVDGGVDVDAGIQQLLDVLVALGMAAARNIGVGQLVDEDQIRPPLERGIDIELVQDTIDIDHRLAGEDLKAFQQRLGLPAPVRLHHTNDDVHALLQLGAGSLEHLVGLADAGSGTDKILRRPTRLFSSRRASASRASGARVSVPGRSADPPSSCRGLPAGLTPTSPFDPGPC